MENYHVVTNFNINQIIKNNSKYYNVSLGLSSTFSKKSGVDRTYNENDQFSYVYSTVYKTSIYCQGTIGNIKFYTDHFIKEDKIAFYYDREEFVFDFDIKMLKEKGTDGYLGYLLKEVKESYKRIKNISDDDKDDVVSVGNAEKVMKNPGSVTYEDIKAYLQNKR